MTTNTDSFRTFRRFVFQAEREVAFDSPDHLHPWGTKQDNSRNRRFNHKLYALYGRNNAPLWILDMGCAGGGFVKDCLDEGCIAMGLEGSDFSKRLRRAEWRTIPENLFTADVTHPFRIQGEFQDGIHPVQFDFVTCWEMIEHIAEGSLKQVADNVKKHLKPNGLWIMSVATMDDIQEGVNLHQTVKPREWWLAKFKELGFQHLEQYVRYFNTQFVRGPKYTAGNSFHLVLSTDPDKAPRIPKESLSIRFYDAWLGSKLQRFIAGQAGI
jgi:2-polyprenyl-3-methyl-5-hydroxy-6-metoxy-1,4-benzoquinol methylase